MNKSGRGRPAGAADDGMLLSGDKLLAVVEFLMRQAEPVSARVIAERVGINRATCHRALNTLIHRRWVERRLGSADYQLSLGFLAAAHIVAHSRSILQDTRRALEPIWQLARETVHIGVLDGFQVLHVEKIDCPQRVGVSSGLGSRGPAHTAALGKALLAAGSDSFVEEYIAYATDPTVEERIADPAAFRREIARTRERGYAIDNEEDAIGVRCLGAAVVGVSGAPIFAFSVTGPAARFTLERAEALAPEVVATAHALSRQYGWEPEPIAGEAAAPSGERGLAAASAS